MAARKAPLRAVKADEAPVKPKPKTLVEAVESGDYREILVAQRLEIARAIPEEKGPAKAALHRQLSMIAKELAAIDTADGEDDIGKAASTPDEAWDQSAI